MTLRPTAVLLTALFIACGSPEVRIGAAQGIPAVTGSTEVALDTFTCGNPIPAGEYTITTRAVGTDCELSFDKDVQVLKADDYSNIPELRGASSLLQAVELQVKKLTFTDSTTNTPLDLNTRVTQAVLEVNGQQVADKAALATLPTTVRLEGSALTTFKAKVDARQPASVHVTALVTLPPTPRPPTRLKIDYDSQPTLVLGTGTLKL